MACAVCISPQARLPASVVHDALVSLAITGLLAGCGRRAFGRWWGGVHDASGRCGWTGERCEGGREDGIFELDERVQRSGGVSVDEMQRVETLIGRRESSWGGGANSKLAALTTCGIWGCSAVT